MEGAICRASDIHFINGFMRTFEPSIKFVDLRRELVLSFKLDGGANKRYELKLCRVGCYAPYLVVLERSTVHNVIVFFLANSRISECLRGKCWCNWTRTQIGFADDQLTNVMIYTGIFMTRCNLMHGPKHSSSVVPDHTGVRRIPDI